MKKTIINALLILCAMSGWAQNTNDSICVFDGTLTNVPDGTEIWVSVPNTDERLGVCTVVPVTKVKDGKFHFDRALEHGKSPYFQVGIFPNGSVRVEVYPGMKTTITGDGMNPRTWTAVNDHPEQKESNLYKKFKREKLADFMAIHNKFEMAASGAYIDTTEVGDKSLKEALDYYRAQLAPLWDGYLNTMYEFMKDRSFGIAYECETAILTDYAHHKKNEEMLNKCRELYAKFPDDNSIIAPSIKRQLKPSYKSLEAGDQAKDFTLNDHDGKPHGILETLGKGKYLLLEIAWKGCSGEKLNRPDDVLKGLYSKYSDKFDIVTIATCAKEKFDMKEFPREEWLELNLSTSTESPIEEMEGTYFHWGERFIFIAPDGNILGKCDSEELKEGAKKYFSFVVE